MFCLYDRYPGTMFIQTERADFTAEEKSSVRMDLLFSGKSVLLYTSSYRKPLLERQAGTSISLKDRRAAPALGSRLLRSYVPLRCGPNASGSARDTDVPAHVRQSDFSISSYITKTDFTAVSLFSGSQCFPDTPEAAGRMFHHTVFPVLPSRFLHPGYPCSRQ